MKSNIEFLPIIFISLLFTACDVDEIPPEIPNEARGWFTIDANNIGVNLNWSGVEDEDIDKYIIFKSTDGLVAQEIGETENNYFKDSDVEWLKYYQYYIQSVDEVGNKSELSDSVLVRIYSASGNWKLNNFDSTYMCIDHNQIISTSSGSILLEAGTLDSSSKLEGEEFYITNETDATDSDRPYEGDAIYHPILKKMFQVNFVDHDDPFWQLDNNPVYKLRCRLFDYSAEAIDTGIETIDAIEAAQSSDYQFTLEQDTATIDAMMLEDEEGRVIHQTESDELMALESSTMTTSAGSLVSESGDYLVQESYIIGDMSTDKTSQNELFDSLDDTVLDFSELNPFGDGEEF